MRLVLSGFAFLAVLGSGAACARDGDEELTVFAAISLRRPLEEIADAFEAQHPASEVVFTFAGSQRLRFQLEQGAEADLFIAADERQMEQAQAAGLVEGAPRLFARNRLAVALADGNPANVRRLEDLAQPGVRLVSAGEAVPLGRYTRLALEAMTAAYGDDFPQRVAANVVSEEENAEAVVGKVELGEADAAFVYQSDVRRLERQGAQVLPVPDFFQPQIGYHAAVLREAGDGVLARAFVDFLLSREAQRILSDHGFRGVR